MRIPFASELISQVAPSLGILVELEPEYGFAGVCKVTDGGGAGGGVSRDRFRTDG